ncbi:hypothetical protein ACHQM5_022256 [Ranunculus cassubicifolius]
MATLLHPTNLNDPIQFSKQCNLNDPIQFSKQCNLNDPMPVSKEEEEEETETELDRFAREFYASLNTSGSYWLHKGHGNWGKVYEHKIRFENGFIFVDEKNYGTVSAPENQPFIESLWKLEVPDAFSEDGTHEILVKKIGEEPARFDKDYFERMRDVNAWDSGEE